ncbi:MAG: SGNH/GDSL hydrolase family protein [Flavobacteriales bacterium]
MSRIETDAKVLIVLGEPDIRHVLELKGSEQETEKTLGFAASNFAHILLEMAATFDHELFVMMTVPTERPEHNKWARYYNSILEKSLSESKVKYIDFWMDIVDELGLVQRMYMADHIHLNSLIVPLVAPKLEIKNPTENFEWSFFYKFILDKHITGIWGDVSTSNLNPELRKRQFDKFPKTAQNHLIVDFLKKVVSIPYSSKILVSGAREGWFYYALLMAGYRNIYLHEPNSSARKLGNRLYTFIRSRSMELPYIEPTSSVDFDLHLMDHRILDSDNALDKFSADRTINIYTDLTGSNNAAATYRLPFASLTLIDSHQKTILKGIKHMTLNKIKSNTYRFKQNHESKKVLFIAD